MIAVLLPTMSVGGVTHKKKKKKKPWQHLFAHAIAHETPAAAKTRLDKSTNSTQLLSGHMQCIAETCT